LAEREFKVSAAFDNHVDQLEVLSTTFLVHTLVVLSAGADIPKEFELLGSTRDR
jgi:hypothetical protein